MRLTSMCCRMLSTFIGVGTAASLSFNRGQRLGKRGGQPCFLDNFVCSKWLDLLTYSGGSSACTKKSGTGSSASFRRRPSQRSQRRKDRVLFRSLLVIAQPRRSDSTSSTSVIHCTLEGRVGKMILPWTLSGQCRPS